jgi:uncharacterized protein (DUF433 family)
VKPTQRDPKLRFSFHRAGSELLYNGRQEDAMSDWQPAAYKDYQWIVADPQLLGGKLAIRGTRLAVSLILECLASGMSLDDIDQSFDGDFPRQALPEVLKVASEFTDSFRVAA